MICLIPSNPFSRELEVVRKAAPGIAEDCPCDLLLIRKKLIINMAIDNF